REMDPDARGAALAVGERGAAVDESRGLAVTLEPQDLERADLPLGEEVPEERLHLARGEIPLLGAEAHERELQAAVLGEDRTQPVGAPARERLPERARGLPRVVLAGGGKESGCGDGKQDQSESESTSHAGPLPVSGRIRGRRRDCQTQAIPDGALRFALDSISSRTS